MRIASFIRDNMPVILDEWEQFARGVPVAATLPRETLRDHAKGILLAIADDLEREESAAQAEQKAKGQGVQPSSGSQAGRHGSDRGLEGFTVSDAMSEFRALRASVVRLWSAASGQSQECACADLIRFNEAVDQALTDSMTGYSDDKERRSRLYDTLLSVSPDLSFIVAPDTSLIYGNAALATEFGAPLSALRGKRFADIDGHAQTRFENDVAMVARTLATALGEIARDRRGSRVTYEYLLVPVTDDEGKVEAVAGIARDVSDRKATAERYKRSAQYDELTGLPNRYLFRDRLHHELKRARRLRLPLALMFIDLDGFKQVNDLLGHEAGDELLRQAAARIRACVRGTDTVARLGGDEFTVILSEIRDMPHVNILAQQIIDELAREFSIIGRKVTISASVGVALAPEDADDPAPLLRHADHAMYAAKQAGRNRYCFSTSEMRRAAWEHGTHVGELRDALARHQLKVLYQPIVALQDGSVVGAEAQLCWPHPLRGLLWAREFSDLAVEAGLIREIDELVLHEALARSHEWAQLEGPAMQVSIERSSLLFGNKAAEQQCHAIIHQIHDAGSEVALEITEAMVLSEAPGSRNVLSQLAGSGVPLLLDDFGSGYSSLTSLTRVPLAGLRIASELVHKVSDSTARSLAAGIIATGHALGMKVLAEGVETDEQEAQLLELGCDYGQGSHFYAAMEGRAFHKLIEKAP